MSVEDGNQIDPPLRSVLLNHVLVGLGTGFLGAGASMVWFVLVALIVAEQRNGLVLVPFVVVGAALVGSVVGGVLALVLGWWLWVLAGLRSARWVFAVTAASCSGAVMGLWSSDLGLVVGLVVGAGSAAVSAWLAWDMMAEADDNLRHAVVRARNRPRFAPVSGDADDRNR